MSQKDLMLAGAWYNCLDPELEDLRQQARIAVHEHNTMHPDEREALAPKLRALLGSVGSECFAEAPFHCAYGFNIHVAEGVYFNAGCTILDTAPVRIGRHSIFGPGVHIYCAHHAKDTFERERGQEIARPVTIGRNVWVGGGAILLPSVTIGDEAIIGAGSVVTKDVPARSMAVGNPARLLG